MWGRQDHWERIANGLLVLLFSLLILSLWMIRSADQREQWYASKSQLLMSMALAIEDDISAYAKGELSDDELVQKQIKIDRFIADLQEHTKEEIGSKWKNDFVSRLDKTKAAWVKDKSAVERIQLGKRLVEEKGATVEAISSQLDTLRDSVTSNAAYKSLDQRQAGLLLSSIEDVRKNLNEVIQEGASVSWRTWEKLQNNLELITDARTGRRISGQIDSTLSLISSQMDALKGDERANQKLEMLVENYESDLFHNASRLSLLIGDKPAGAFASTFVSILLTLSIGLVLLWRQYGQRRFNDDLVAELMGEREEIEEQIKLFTHEASNMIDGNLNVEFTVKEGLTQELAETMNMAIQTIDKMIRRVIMQIKKIQHDTMSANAMFSQTQSMFGKEDKIINAAINNMKNVSTVLMKSSKHSESVIAEAELTVSEAHKNVDRIRESLANITGIGNKIIDLREKVARLSQNQEGIQQNVALVEDATEQTIILALNAAIQAASASQGGQGFAIVATEMQELADQIEDAMTEIKGSMESISKGLAEISESVSHSTEVIEGEIVLTEETAQCLIDIEQAANQLESIIASAAKATAIESSEAQSVADSSAQLNSGMKHLGSSLEEIQHALESISADSNRLSDDINTFVLWEDNHAK